MKKSSMKIMNNVYLLANQAKGGSTEIKMLPYKDNRYIKN